MFEVCCICEKEVETNQDFYDRGRVCDSCWREWELENREQEFHYWNTRL